jgi:hypothetical protein
MNAKTFGRFAVNYSSHIASTDLMVVPEATKNFELLLVEGDSTAKLPAFLGMS